MLKRLPIMWKLSGAFLVIILLMGALEYYLWHSPDPVIDSSIGIIIALGAAVILSCGMAWIIVSIYIKRPVRKLTDGMNKLAEKEFNIRLDEDEKDGFGSLASSFNDMAAMLSFFLAELKKARDYLEGILESTADIIITVNTSGRILTSPGLSQAGRDW
jgi:methyl-accepting chemotaxis protein